MNASKSSIIAGAVFAFLSVAFGAFGAHALKDFLLAQARLDTYQTAVQYQMYHALGLILVGILGHLFPKKDFKMSAILFTAGIVIFSGSLYLLCGLGIKWLGAITPIGGICFLSGWLLLIFKVRLP